MKAPRLAPLFVLFLFSVLLAVTIPTYAVQHVETDAEFMARVCAGVYLTSDAETIAEGMGESK